MKIEWLDDQRARVTRGWFTRVHAEVYLWANAGFWRFVETDECVPLWLDVWLDWSRSRRRRRAPWKRALKLPAAHIVSDRDPK